MVCMNYVCKSLLLPYDAKHITCVISFAKICVQDFANACGISKKKFVEQVSCHNVLSLLSTGDGSGS